MFHVEHPGYPGARINQVSELIVAYTTILSALRRRVAAKPPHLQHEVLEV